jgi:urocanate hydratase
MTDSVAHGSATYEPARAPRGSTISCKGWPQEAALRMLMNSLDPEVAECPEELIAYGGRGKPARNWQCFHAIVASLRELSADQTLLIQSGKPVGVLRTHSDAPRVLIANSNLVGRWNCEKQFGELEHAGLTMFGQLTAGSWLYVGTQGALPTACEIFAAAARKHFGGSLSGRLVVSGGMGGVGGAQPLAATLNGAAFLGIEIDPERIKRRIRAGYCEVMVTNLDEALRILKNAVFAREATSVGLIGNSAAVIPELARRGVVPDLVTDLTPAHDPLGSYIPQGLTREQAGELRQRDSRAYREQALVSIATQVRGMLELQKLGAIVFDSGNSIRRLAQQCGVQDAGTLPGCVPEYLRPLLCEGRAPLLWVALSGDGEDIARADRMLLDLIPEQDVRREWLAASRRIRFQGLPARACWLGWDERAKFAQVLNNMVATGEVAAPFVIGSGYMTGASAASPDHETENMPDGSDGIADWPMLGALLAAVSGVAWVSIHNGGGTGIGNAQNAAYALLADGAKESSRRIESVLAAEASMGLIRHSEAGYSEARESAIKHDIRMPMP